MRKITIGLVSVALLFSLNMAIAKAEVYSTIPHNPFSPVWQAIEELQEIVVNLQEQINNIELIPGPEGPQGPQGEQGPTGPSLKVIDAEGKEIGYLVDFLENSYDIALIFETEIHSLVERYISTGEMYSIHKIGNFWYESDDCTGPRLIQESNPYSSLHYNENDGNWYYVASYDDIIYNAQIRSTYNPTKGCLNYDDTFAAAAKVTEVVPPDYLGPLSIVVE